MNTVRKCFNTSNFCIQAGKKQDGKHLLPEFCKKVWLLSTTLNANHVFWEQSAIPTALSWYLPCHNSASAEKFVDLASCLEQTLCQSITVTNVAQQNHHHPFCKPSPSSLRAKLGAHPSQGKNNVLVPATQQRTVSKC